jgi:hypothetical protein
MTDSKLAAKEMALKLRAKAELLESLNEEQLVALKVRVQNQNSDSNAGCWFSTPCHLIECIGNSEA